MSKQSPSLYGFPTPINTVFPAPIIAQRAPTTADISYPIGQSWIDEVGDDAYVLVDVTAGVATWNVTATTPGNVDTLTGNSGGAITPSAGNINLAGGTLANFVGSGSTLTLTPKASGYPVTPFIVGTSGKAGYQTIQTAITAANSAGGGLVWIQPGTYTENLTLFSNVFLQGSSKHDVTIIGVHTPPTSGNLSFNELTLQSATDILNSAAAGTTSVYFQHCNFTITSGWACNLTNWTGYLEFGFCGEVGSTNSGILNNSTTATFAIFNSSIGAGTGKTLTSSSSAATIDESSILCPVTISGSGTLDVVAGALFYNTFTTAGSVVCTFANATFATGATVAISHGSSGGIFFNKVTIDTSFNPSIDGAGSGALEFGMVVWIDNDQVAVALTIATNTELSASSFTTSDANKWITWLANNLTAGGVATNEDLQLAGQAAGNVIVTAGNLVINQAAKQLRVHGGAVTDFIGTGTLSSGTVTIANTNIASTDRIFLQRIAANGSTTFGELSYTISASTSFTVTSLILGTPGSTQTADTSTFSYFIVRQI